MADIESLYKKKDGKILIEIKLTSLTQLFNSFDPAPFYEKELDWDAERYIVDTVNDFPKKTQFSIVVHVPANLASSPEGEALAPAIRNHFRYKTLEMERKFRQRIKNGRLNLLISLVFLFFAVFVSRTILQMGSTLIHIFISDAFIISGWVAMWTPVTLFLYELYPIIQTKNIYERISRMEIEIRSS